MSILREFSEAQIFFFFFLLLSLPAFLYLYLIATRDTATPAQDSFEGQPASKLPQTTERSLQPMPASDYGCNPSAEPRAALLEGKAAKWPASGAADVLAPVTSDTDRRKELPAAGMAHPPIDRNVAILPWHPRPLAVHKLEAAPLSQERGYQVPAGLTFGIMVEIGCLADGLGDETALPESAGTSGLFEIGQGDEVGLFLECLPCAPNAWEEDLPVEIDVPYQAFRLESRPLTAVFAARSKPAGNAAKAKMLLRIISGSVELGTIDFELTVDPSAGGAA